MSQQAGYAITEQPDEAEVIVVNTCGFIGAAKEESIDTILEMARYKQKGACKRLVVTGCLSQRYPDDLRRELPEIDHLLGSGEVEKVAAAIVGQGALQDVASVPDYLYDHTTPRVPSQALHTRYVKIAEGCDRPCGFCIIPKLRGPQRSRSVASIEAEVRDLSRRGVVEVNLVAQDLTTYGTDLASQGKPPNLASLLRVIGQPDTKNHGALRWVRLHYAYPTAVTDELLDTIAEMPLVAKYLDVPLQHADDQVLKRMRRGHVGKTVWQLCERARAAVPEIVLRTTFIVGHPGETEESFLKLCEFVRQVGFDHVGVFTYSKEEGTASAQLGEEVPAKEAERRRRELMRIQRQISRRKLRSLVGSHVEVLVEGPSEESEYLLCGRHRGQAPEIDGQVFLSFGEAFPETSLQAGDVVMARVEKYADYDLSAEVRSLVQGAQRVPSVVRLPLVSTSPLSH